VQKKSRRAGKNYFTYTNLIIQYKIPDYSEEIMDIIREWCRQYKLNTIFDPFHARDIKSCSSLTSSENSSDVTGTDSSTCVGGDASCRLQVVANKILSRGLEVIHQERACNTILINISDVSVV